MNRNQETIVCDTHLFVSLTFFCHALMSARPLSGLNAFTGPEYRVGINQILLLGLIFDVVN